MFFVFPPPPINSIVPVYFKPIITKYVLCAKQIPTKTFYRRKNCVGSFVYCAVLDASAALFNCSCAKESTVLAVTDGE